MEDCNNVGKVFFVVPMGVNVHVDVGIVRKLDLVNLGNFLGCDNVHHRYVRDGSWLLSCPFSHSASFNPSGVLRVVLILVWCQSPVLSGRFLKEYFCGTCKNPAAWMMAWTLAECKNFLVPEKKPLVPTSHVWPIGLSGTVKNWPLTKCTAWHEQGFEFKVS